MNLFQDSTLHRLNKKFRVTSFDCRNPDLNEFLQQDAIPYMKELMGVTYVFSLDEDPGQIVCFFTISNDSIRLDTLYNSAKKKVNKGVSRRKQMRAYPAVKIGRLGVNAVFAGQRIGSQLMDFIKGWFVDGRNKTGCRFIIVDAYNETNVLDFYKKNDFEYLMSEEKEAEIFHISTEALKTRIMYFDLMKLV